MSVQVFDPMTVVVGPIGPMMAAKVENTDLQAFFESKSGDDGDGNLSAIVVGDSEKMGVGVGTWDAGQHTQQPILLHFDEALFIIDGSFQITTDGNTHLAKRGECVHIAAGSLVNFASEEGCRLVWVTSPPTWKAFEMAWQSGQFAKPAVSPERPEKQMRSE